MATFTYILIESIRKNLNLVKIYFLLHIFLGGRLDKKRVKKIRDNYTEHTLVKTITKKSFLLYSQCICIFNV